ncbi:hypothetical protein [Novosphingobium sp.]|uniref:hypothetical protein n=1 Tax=Novosphingobium sp. TaxID=1874826 RepID=UPI003D0B21D3
MHKIILGALTATILTGAIAGATTASAQPWGPPPPQSSPWWSQHPGYLHAMADLRSAYWLIQHRAPTDPVQGAQEQRALGEIRAAYQDLRQASVIDDKNIDDQPPADFAWGDHGGRLHKAMALLQRAHADLAHEEDNPAARGLRNRATQHVDNAGRMTAAAMQAWHF